MMVRPGPAKIHINAFANETAMTPTPVSLLNRLQQQPGDAQAWQRFDALYRPLLRAWLRRHVRHQDVDDLVQDVLAVVVRELPLFRYDPAKGRFRDWLKSILIHRVKDFLRWQRTQPQTDAVFFATVANQLEDPASELSRVWDREYDRCVLGRLLRQVRPDFQPATWDAFWLVVFERRPVPDVAEKLGLTPNAVRIAKYRVITGLRQAAAGLLD
jgi:RNA polymerase sigma-70 factor (ECF subfamily)